MSTAFVLDASVALGWALHDSGGAGDPARTALELGEAEAIVPTLWRYELAAALLANQRHERLTPSDVGEFLDALQDLPIYEEDAWPSALSMIRQGAIHGLTGYDASYLILAQRLALPLATHDEGLRGAAQEAEIALL